MDVFAVADETRGIEVWNHASGQRLNAIPFDGQIWSMALSPNGQLLAASSFRGKHFEQPIIKLWDLSAGTERTLDRFPAISVEFSPDGKLLVAGGGRWNAGRVSFFDPISGNRVRDDLAFPSLVYQARFNPHGDALVIPQRSGEVMLWDTLSQKRHFAVGGNALVVAIAFTPDGNTLALGDWENVVSLWHAESGRQLGALHTDAAVMSLEFSDDGHVLAAGCGDKSIKLWHKDGREEIHFVR